jgi:hypothetical protein
MKYAIQIRSGTMIHSVSEVERGYTDTQTAWPLHKFSFIL